MNCFVLSFYKTLIRQKIISTFIVIQKKSLFHNEQGDIIQIIFLFELSQITQKTTSNFFLMYNNVVGESSASLQRSSSEEIIQGKCYVRSYAKYKKIDNKLHITNRNKKFCERYKSGKCSKGRYCRFSHSYVPDIAKRLCLKFINGKCKNGENCFYSHNLKRYPCRNFTLTGVCEKDIKCQYSHEKISSEEQEQYQLENIDFIKKVIKCDESLKEKYDNIIKKHSQIEGLKKEQSQSYIKELPQCFWLPTKCCYFKDQQKVVEKKPEEQQKKQKQIIQKRQKFPKGQNKHPFSIRLISKNRQPLPEKLPQNQNKDQVLSTSNPEPQPFHKCSSELMNEIEYNKKEVKANQNLFIQRQQKYKKSIEEEINLLQKDFDLEQEKNKELMMLK